MRVEFGRFSSAGFGMVASLAVSVLGGCRTSDPIGAWQQKLTDYVVGEGNGDPGSLRNAAQLRSSQSLRPAQIRFAATGISGGGIFAPDLDVQGILVGRTADLDPPFDVFLVGVNRRRSSGEWEVLDIRPVAFHVRGEQLDWLVGPSQDRSLERYRAAARTPNCNAFPRLDDAFQLETPGSEFVIRDSKSGAVWRLSRPPPRRPRP